MLAVPFAQSVRTSRLHILMQSLRLALQLVDCLLLLGKCLLHLVQHLHFYLLQAPDLVVCTLLFKVVLVLLTDCLGRSVLILVLASKFGVHVLLLPRVVAV